MKFAVLCVVVGAVAVASADTASPTTVDPNHSDSSPLVVEKNYNAVSSDDIDVLNKQRETYRKALKALRRGPTITFKGYKNQLKDYPLYAYLEYAELATRLRKLPRKQVERFLDQYQGSRIADKLRLRWLKELKRRRRGADFVHYYRADLADTRLTCYYHYARYRTGDDKQQEHALNEAMKLWLVGKSQPDECNKLFELLSDNHRLSDQRVWQRYTMALSNRKYQLARYLGRQIEQQPYRDWAANASTASKQPQLIGEYQWFSDHSAEMLRVIEHGLRRLTSEDASLALGHWAHYQQTHRFTIQARGRITGRLIKGLYRQGHANAADEYLNSNLDILEPDLLEWRIRQALATQDWLTGMQWIDKLPGEYHNEPRWRYWRARLAQQLHGEDPAQVYSELAQRRSFYGFLASEQLNGNYAMGHQPVTIDEYKITELEKLPGIQLARELYHHGEVADARREWRKATRHFSERQWQLAAELTRRWNWSNQSIMSMISASYWDDIEMRFPLTYQPQMVQYGTALNMDTHLLLALARQESALSEDATSPAGARGLMQLLPSTAKQTARKYNIKYRNSDDLFDPAKNIALGSHYYRQLLDRFNNNRILATAAYNAGPHRVSRWLKESDGTLSYDVWVETIPFKETRNYVQNVLAFSVIYGHLLDINDRMLTDAEKEMPL